MAYGFEFPDIGYLEYTDFSGGKKTVVKLLESLGFNIVEKTILSSVLEAFTIFKKESSIDEIKETIIDKTFEIETKSKSLINKHKT